MQALGWIAQPAVFPWVALAVGLCAGSFLNVVIHRLPRMMDRAWRDDAREILASAGEPRKEWRMWKPERRRNVRRSSARQDASSDAADQGAYNLFVPRSGCPGCGHQIAWWENIPVVSYLALRGRCSACGAGISARYPVVELIAGVASAYSAWHFGFGAQAIAAALFAWCVIALAYIDQATGYLYDDVTLPLLWAGLLFNAFGTFVPVREAVVGAAAGYLSLWSVYWLFKLATGQEGMGYGDFKMNAAVGAFLGWKVLPIVILLSAVVGLAFGIAQMLVARGGWVSNFKFHFGPYIAIAGIITLFWGPAIFSLVPAIKPF